MIFFMHHILLNAYKVPTAAIFKKEPFMMVNLTGLFLMSLATGSILIPKLILIATTLIFAPYILPITMVAELLIIVLLNWCLFGNISKII